MKTSQDVTMNFRGMDITIPKGTKLTHRTACGIDNRYHFVDDLKWIDIKYPRINRVLKHEATFYGIDIPKEFVDFNK